MSWSRRRRAWTAAAVVYVMVDLGLAVAILSGAVWAGSRCR